MVGENQHIDDRELQLWSIFLRLNDIQKGKDGVSRYVNEVVGLFCLQLGWYRDQKSSLILGGDFFMFSNSTHKRFFKRSERNESITRS